MNLCQFHCDCPVSKPTAQHHRGPNHPSARVQSLLITDQAQLQLDAGLLTGSAALLRNSTKVLLYRLKPDNHQFELEWPVFHCTVYVVELKSTQVLPKPYGPDQPTCKRLPQQVQPIFKTLTNRKEENSHTLKRPSLLVRISGEVLPPPSLQRFDGTACLALGERNFRSNRGQDELTLVAFSNLPGLCFRLSKGQRGRSCTVCRLAQPKSHDPQENGGCNSESRHSNSPCVPFRLASLSKEPARAECVQELHTPLPIKKGTDDATKSIFRQGLTQQRQPNHESLTPSYCHTALLSLLYRTGLPALTGWAVE